MEHPMVDLSNQTVEELNNLIEEAKKQIEVTKITELDNAYLSITGTAEKLGVSVEDILAHGEKRKLNKKKTEKAKVEPRYRNKDNHEETWTGRGKQPRWLVAKIENGAALEDFLI